MSWRHGRSPQYLHSHLIPHLQLLVPLYQSPSSTLDVRDGWRERERPRDGPLPRRDSTPEPPGPKPALHSQHERRLAGAAEGPLPRRDSTPEPPGSKPALHSRQERRLAGATEGSLPRLDSALWHCVRGGVAWAPELR
eukprot:scaffold7125_cov118-Isochrysis_galbana.AAC.3